MSTFLFNALDNDTYNNNLDTTIEENKKSYGEKDFNYNVNI